MHPTVVKVSKSRFTSGHYADSAESAFKELNAQVKKIYRASKEKNLDGVDLMRKAFAPSSGVIKLEDSTSHSAQNVQQGFLELYAGAMAGIRNPIAHQNVSITSKRAVHYLMLASLLFYRLDERKHP